MTVSIYLVLVGCASLTSSEHFPSSSLQQLPEQYIWFSTASPDNSSPRFFRKSFATATVFAHATLYFTGPYHFDIFVNGILVSHSAQAVPGIIHDRPVIVIDITQNIRLGPNTVAIAASTAELMALKIVPASPGIDAEPLIISDGSWKGSERAPVGWEQPRFDDNSWEPVKQLGSIESDTRNFEWNLDLGLYQWPGYQGSNRLLKHSVLQPKTITSLERNALFMDFGREITGRLRVTSHSKNTLHLLLTYGESEEEAMSDFSFLGSRNLIVPPGATAAGPSTAFRFVRVVFENSTASSSADMDADMVYVELIQQGSFQSSDELLNRIWQASMYTTQLAMQTSFWDAPKRDRKPFSGDLFVAARTARIAFGDNAIIRNTLSELLRRELVLPNSFTTIDINNISSYDAYWVLALADEYQFSGDLVYLKANCNSLLDILGIMAREVDQNNLFINTNGALVFADWSPGMLQFASIKGSDAFTITTMIFSMAFETGAHLLWELGETAAASKYCQIAAAMKNAAATTYLDTIAGTFGPRTQTNAMAIFAGIPSAKTSQTIFAKILSRPPSAPVSPFFNYFVISAMAETGHRAEALRFIRQFWGSMLDRGTSTFWEMYDPKCITTVNFHSCLVDYLNSFDPQGSNSLFISLAHGWSSGPVPWLNQEILGIRPLSPGFKKVLIRPDLAQLQWAKGTQPTPNGTISVDIRSSLTLALELPSGTQATVSMPTTTQNPVVIINGSPVVGTLTEEGARTLVQLPAGSFLLQSF